MKLLLRICTIPENRMMKLKQQKRLSSGRPDSEAAKAEVHCMYQQFQPAGEEIKMRVKVYKDKGIEGVVRKWTKL